MKAASELPGVSDVFGRPPERVRTTLISDNAAALSLVNHRASARSRINSSFFMSGMSASRSGANVPGTLYMTGFRVSVRLFWVRVATRTVLLV